MSKRPIRLTEKYRPHRVEDFIGLQKVKPILTNFLKNPYPAAFLFVGSSGCGKTAIAIAMAEALHSKPLHLASETCNYDNLDKLLGECEMCPTFWNGEHAEFHFILIDEIDSTTATAQRRLLAKLDASELIENAVFVLQRIPPSEKLKERAKASKNDWSHDASSLISQCGGQVRTLLSSWQKFGGPKAERGRSRTGNGSSATKTATYGTAYNASRENFWHGVKIVLLSTTWRDSAIKIQRKLREKSP